MRGLVGFIDKWRKLFRALDFVAALSLIAIGLWAEINHTSGWLWIGIGLIILVVALIDPANRLRKKMPQVYSGAHKAGSKQT